MAYVITEPCVGVKDGACLDVCPIDCIYTSDADDMYFIHPDECIDCGACLPECPVNAIYEEAEVPQKWQRYITINAAYFETCR
jgi:ferredoxin